MITIDGDDRWVVLNTLRVTGARRIAAVCTMPTCGRGRESPRYGPGARTSASTHGTRLASNDCTVDCWIGVEHEGDQWLVRLAGRLSVDQVPDLLKVCGEHGSESVAVELSDLLSADAAGLDALRRLRRAGALLTGTPAYIQLKLDAPA